MFLKVTESWGSFPFFKFCQINFCQCWYAWIILQSPPSASFLECRLVLVLACKDHIIICSIHIRFGMPSSVWAGMPLHRMFLVTEFLYRIFWDRIFLDKEFLYRIFIDRIIFDQIFPDNIFVAKIVLDKIKIVLVLNLFGHEFLGPNYGCTQFSLYRIVLYINVLDRIFPVKKLSQDRIFLELIFWTESSGHNFLNRIFLSHGGWRNNHPVFIYHYNEPCCCCIDRRGELHKGEPHSSQRQTRCSWLSERL